ncbi:hypothetical protein BT63DRAFT_293685 [Microthyrium microscopicum]|uniref:Uncharacterized protein n=1 Tax=Microthyrium microscopicum TaxID=703497 RepID=A0A6A6U6E0_9PEZI|nr:hypothetical protein BT63DRAFT_293685 [Microthyrium microscopicum]
MMMIEKYTIQTWCPENTLYSFTFLKTKVTGVSLRHLELIGDHLGRQPKTPQCPNFYTQLPLRGLFKLIPSTSVGPYSTLNSRWSVEWRRDCRISIKYQLCRCEAQNKPHHAKVKGGRLVGLEKCPSRWSSASRTSPLRMLSGDTPFPFPAQYPIRTDCSSSRYWSRLLSLWTTHYQMPL